MAVLAAHAQEAVLEAAAFQVRLELLLHILRQRPAGGFTLGCELGVVPLDEVIEQRRLEPMASVARRIDERWRTRACTLPRHGVASVR
jgi:hypothetical protein